MKRSFERDPIPLKTKRAVWARSDYTCEACGLEGATHIHHRKLRSQGGTNDLENLLNISAQCHARIHSNPADSYERGLMVRRAGIPALVPVLMYGEGL